MRKKLALLLMTATVTVAAAAPVWACTPPLSPPKLPDLEKAYEACREAGKKAAENVVVPDSYFKNETETETESETVIESEPETAQKYIDWKQYIPESFRVRWLNIVRR